MSAHASPAPRAALPPATASRASLPRGARSVARAASSASSASGATTMPDHLHVPSARDAAFGGNVARYLLEMDAATTPSATFNFCGGMMFALSLSPALRRHLSEVADAGESDARQPVVHPAEARRMAHLEHYARDASADDVRVFHGREVRDVPGLGMLIHLSLADPKAADPEGWSRGEREDYAGWLSDRQRRWRDGPSLAREGGFADFPVRFGPDAFCLHHRFYLHADARGGIWLAAEDGCEGVAQPRRRPERDFDENGGARSAFGALGSIFKK